MRSKESYHSASGCVPCPQWLTFAAEKTHQKPGLAVARGKNPADRTGSDWPSAIRHSERFGPPQRQDCQKQVERRDLTLQACLLRLSLERSQYTPGKYGACLPNKDLASEVCRQRRVHDDCPLQPHSARPLRSLPGSSPSSSSIAGRSNSCRD